MDFNTNLWLYDWDWQAFAEFSLLNVEQLAEEIVHIFGQIPWFSADVRGDKVRDGLGVRVGEVQYCHPILVNLVKVP